MNIVVKQNLAKWNKRKKILFNKNEIKTLILITDNEIYQLPPTYAWAVPGKYKDFDHLPVLDQHHEKCNNQMDIVSMLL